MHQQVDRFIEGAGCNNLPGVYKEYLVGILDGVQAMGNDHLGGGWGQILHNGFQLLFGHCIDIGGGFIKDQKFRFSQDRPHESDQLLLAQADPVP